MKKILFKLIIFITPILFIAFPLDKFISKKLSESNIYPGELEVWNDIYNNNINADIAIYGASNAAVQINPKIIEDSLSLKAYNFGMKGYNFSLQYFRHKEYIDNNKLPKYIILTLNLQILSKRKDLYNSNQFLPYLLWNDTYKRVLSSYVGFKNLDFEVPLFRYFGRSEEIKMIVKNTLLNKKNESFRYRGYRGLENKWSSKYSNLQKVNLDIDSSTKNLFDNFLKECKEQKIKVVLIIAPVYIDAPNFIVNSEEVMELYRGYANKYSLLFLDYRIDSLSYNKDNFHDAFHLNYLGADKFSRKLSSDLKINLQLKDFK